MKQGSIVRHCKTKHEGVIINLKDGHAEVLLTKAGMYKPEVYDINELEIISEN